MMPIDVYAPDPWAAIRRLRTHYRARRNRASLQHQRAFARVQNDRDSSFLGLFGPSGDDEFLGHDPDDQQQQRDDPLMDSRSRDITHVFFVKLLTHVVRILRLFSFRKLE